MPSVPRFFQKILPVFRFGFTHAAQIVYDQLKPLYDEAYHGLESVFQKLYQLSNGRRPDSAVPAPDILRGQDSV